MHGKLNEKLEIDCTSFGSPAPSVLWKSLKNNHFIKPHHYNNFTYNLTSVLVFEKLSVNNSGNYSCEIPGQFDQNSKRIFNLIVQYRPSKPVISNVEAMGEKTKINWY